MDFHAQRSGILRADSILANADSISLIPDSIPTIPDSIFILLGIKRRQLAEFRTVGTLFLRLESIQSNLESISAKTESISLILESKSVIWKIIDFNKT